VVAADSSRPAPPPPDETLPPLGVFGKYRLDRIVGRGGMAVVYDARDLTLDRRVALKVLFNRKTERPHQAMEEWRRFMREARVGANLPKHPNICTLYEAGVIDDRRYLAMEFVEGRPFGEWRQDGRPLRDQVRVLRDVALAVHSAHEQGVLHRDLKPANILVDSAGRPFVTDFGLAKKLAASQAISLTPSGFVVGSPAYMSPEQARGRDELDRRTDVYALGAILYEALTTRPPVEGKGPVEMLSRVIDGAIDPPAERTRKLGLPPPDPELEAICRKAMAPDPEKRHPTAEAMAADLGRWLGDAPPPSRRRGRRAALAAAAGALALAAALGAAARPRPSAAPRGAHRHALLVVGFSHRLGTHDTAVRQRLNALGLAVTVVDLSIVAESDAAGKGLVVLAPSLRGKTFPPLAPWGASPLPILCADPYLWDNLGMAGRNPEEGRGIVEAQTTASLGLPADHPLAAGLPRTIRFFREPTPAFWARPAGNGRVVASVQGDPTRALVFAYSRGASLKAGSAPGRRVGFSFPEDPEVALGEDAWALFDAAVRWCLAPAP
jgi:tRNA A-37 threonylcarbamoyl transferase component Bud32